MKKLRIYVEIDNDLPRDLKFIAFLKQTLDDYKDLPPRQLNAALAWLKSYIRVIENEKRQ